ncbi:MAG: hypothetical protein AAFU33_16995, partial [Bacteroidota bacterium]
MGEFLKTYRGIILLQFILYFVGSILEPLTIPVLAGVYIYWMATEQDRMLLITLLVILIMGDSRAYYFSYYKNLRIVCILLVSIYTMTLMFRGKIKFRSLILGVVPFFLIALLGGLRSPSIGVSLSKMISYFLLIFLTLHFFPYLI